jgi:hypothetical protein
MGILELIFSLACCHSHAYHSLGRAKSAITLCFSAFFHLHRASLFWVVSTPMFFSSVRAFFSQRSWSLLHLWIGVFICFYSLPDHSGLCFFSLALFRSVHMGHHTLSHSGEALRIGKD